jgi:nucleoside-diphosphate-sugar epimerase
VKFTVLGASGTIGQQMVKFLCARNEEVFTPSRNDDSIFNLPLGHVIYAVGITADFRTRPFDTVQAHVCLVNQILQQAHFDSFLYLSSTRLYSNNCSGAEEDVFSVDPQNPSDLYNLSKLMGESLCFSCGRQNVKIARLSNVVGGEETSSDNFLPSLIREARQGKIILRSALTSKKDYIHITDVVSLLYQIATTGKRNLYNVASGQQITHAEWVQHLVSLTGCSYEVVPEAPCHQFVAIDIQKISQEFLFQPTAIFDSLSRDHFFQETSNG